MGACTAWHEAGHCVAAEAVGIEVLSVTVNEDGGSVDRGFFYSPDGAREDAYPVMMMAGCAAEELYWHDPDVAWQHAAGDRAILRKLGHSDAEMLGWTREARAMIASQEAAWSRLAHILAGQGTFPGEMVRSVLAGNPVSGRMALAALELRRAPA